MNQEPRALTLAPALAPTPVPTPVPTRSRPSIGFGPSTAGVRRAAVVVAASLFLAACSGSQPKQAGSEDEFGQKPSDSSAPASGGESAATPPSDTPSGGGESGGRLSKDQQAQMDIALRRGRDKAAQCPDVVPNSPAGEADVKVTFDGKKGRSVDASVGAPFSGTPMEACIKRAFIDEIVMPFDGGNIDMSTKVKLATKAGPVDDKKKPKK